MTKPNDDREHLAQDFYERVYIAAISQGDWSVYLDVSDGDYRAAATGSKLSTEIEVASNIDFGDFDPQGKPTDYEDEEAFASMCIASFGLGVIDEHEDLIARMYRDQEEATRDTLADEAAWLADRGC